MLFPLLACIDPETAHGLIIRAMVAGVLPPGRARIPAGLEVEVLGLSFPSPVGLAAGFDKSAQVPDRALAFGFGFVEVGTLTPRPQAGNPRPRVFRLAADRAVINRFGLNNDGYAAAAARLAARAGRAGIVGVNIGPNKDQVDSPAAYAEGVARFAGLADYIVANVSSPNTPGMRDFQGRERLDALVGAIAAARDGAAVQSGRRVPLVVKIAPDLDEPALADIAAVVDAHGINAVAVSNTTVARPALRDRRGGEAGGLSGRPLFEPSTAVLRRFRRLTGGRMPLIGIGGVDSAETAYAKIRAGATLVQLYTGLIYEGPGLPLRIAHGLVRLLQRDGFARVADAVGADVPL